VSHQVQPALEHVFSDFPLSFKHSGIKNVTKIVSASDSCAQPTACFETELTPVFVIAIRIVIGIIVVSTVAIISVIVVVA
jgi:hypothetical protein